MTRSKENTMKNAVSNTGVLTRFVTRPSGHKTLEVEAAEMRQKNFIRNLDTKQRRKEKATGNQNKKVSPCFSLHMPSQASGLPSDFIILSDCGETHMETYVDY